MWLGLNFMGDNLIVAFQETKYSMVRWGDVKIVVAGDCNTVAPLLVSSSPAMKSEQGDWKGSGVRISVCLIHEI